MAKVAVLERGATLDQDLGMDKVQAAIQQLVARLSGDKRQELWRAAAQGAFGKGSKAQAVQRGIAQQLNYARQDHARRLFLSSIEWFLAHDPRQLALGGLPGLFHVADLGALYLVLRQDALADIDSQAQQYLALRCEQEPVAEVLKHPDAIRLRSAQVDGARPFLQGALKDEALLRRLTLAVNNMRRETTRSFIAGTELDAPHLDMEDVKRLALCLCWAPSMPQSAMRAAAERDATPEATARRFLEARARMETALPPSAKAESAGLWPAMASLHRGNAPELFVKLLDTLSGPDLDRMGRVLNGIVRMQCETLRYEWRRMTAETLPGAATFNAIGQAIVQLHALVDLLLIRNWTGAPAIHRSTQAHVQDIRGFVVETAADTVMELVRLFAKSPKTSETDFQRLRTLVSYLNQSGQLGTDDMKRNRALEHWRVELIEHCHYTFRLANQGVPDALLLGHMVRLMTLVRDAGGNPDPWIFVSSLSLIKGAKVFFMGEAAPFGKTTEGEMEMLAIRLLRMANQDQEQQIQWKDQDLVALKIAGTRWAKNNNRDLKALIGQDVTE